MTSEREPHDLSGLKVLIAEDDRLNLIRVYEILMSMGMEVLATHKSIEAVEKNLLDKPDIILINMDMPELDETNAITIIRKNVPKNKRALIIGLSRNKHKHINKITDLTYPDVFLPYNFTAKELYSVLQNSDIRKKISDLEQIKAKAKQALAFNKEAFIKLMDIDKEKRKSFLENFLFETSQMIVRLKLAIAVKYFPEIEQFAHSVKGSAANVCAEKLNITAYHIEIVGKSNDLRKLNENKHLVEELMANFRDAKQEIKNYISKI